MVLPKTKFTAVLSTFVVCICFWLLLTWSLDIQELAAGAIVSLAVALFSARFFIHENAGWFFNPLKLFTLIYYIIVPFMVELFKANWDVAKRCFKGCKDVHPGIVRVPSELKGDYERAMLGNCITLTPGTISIDIAEDEDKNSWYYIHCIDVSGFDLSDENGRAEAGKSIKGKMEGWIRRIWE